MKSKRYIFQNFESHLMDEVDVKLFVKKKVEFLNGKGFSKEQIFIIIFEDESFSSSFIDVKSFYLLHEYFNTLNYDQRNLSICGNT